MKIMFVIHSLNNVGGAESILVNFANYFSSVMKNNIAIVLLSDMEITFKLETDIKVYSFNKQVANKKFLIWNQITHIRHAIQSFNPDILIGFVASTNILTAFSGWMEDVPVILSEHTSYKRSLTTSRGQISGLIWRALRRVTYPLADKVFILTEEDKKYFYYLKDVEVIPNPLIISNKHLVSSKRENIILAVGRLHNIKGFDMLIKAFSLIANNRWKLYIAGEGEEREKLEKMVKELHLTEKVVFLGFVEDMEYFYRKASIYVLSSRSEGFPGGLCEAMGYGCSVISFDCPTGPKEIIEDGKNGILVAPENIEELSKEIETLMQNETKRLLIASNGRKIVDSLDIDIISKRWIKSINNIKVKKCTKK